VLLDIVLHKMNGNDVCRAMRNKAWGNRMSIVALTGWGLEEDHRKSKDAGFDHHLIKPVELAVLTNVLAECSARHLAATNGRAELQFDVAAVAAKGPNR
jgi:DNA-binding response OmpR family regulator